ncbi:MAG: hypothetical protein J7K78_00190, partial [Thaumarchaeota archaeon]|nr:hypothetical protein [Nitrososphaerota archaeon]
LKKRIESGSWAPRERRYIVEWNLKKRIESRYRRHGLQMSTTQPNLKKRIESLKPLQHFAGYRPERISKRELKDIRFPEPLEPSQPHGESQKEN